MARRMSKKRKDEMARFFEYVYRRALELDPRELPDTEDLVRMLTGLRASARVGFFEATGEWLSPSGAPANPRTT